MRGRRRTRHRAPASECRIANTAYADPDSNAYAHPNSNSNSNSNPDTDTDTNADTNADTNPNAGFVHEGKHAAANERGIDRCLR